MRVGLGLYLVRTCPSNNNVQDIVDTTPYTGKELDAESLVKILLGGINRRIDRNTEPANK